MSKIVLGEEYREIIFNYHEKWRTIAWSTDRINHEQAEEAIDSIYVAMGLKTPKIMFCGSPSIDLLDLIRSNDFQHNVGRPIIKRFKRWKDHKLGNPLLDLWFEFLHDYQWSIMYMLNDELWTGEKVWLDDSPETVDFSGNVDYRNGLNQTSIKIEWKLRDSLWYQMRKLGANENYIYPEKLAPSACWYDFCISELKLIHDAHSWSALQKLIKSCGWIFPFTEVCIVCDRPIRLLFDDLGRLHGEEEPAIQFIDGFRLYARKGKIIG
jgi:hypothetical protein